MPLGIRPRRHLFVIGGKLQHDVRNLMADLKALAFQRFSAVDRHDVAAIRLGNGIPGFTMAKLLMSELGIDSV